jgi:hypothetical protein
MDGDRHHFRPHGNHLLMRAGKCVLFFLAIAVLASGCGADPAHKAAAPNVPKAVTNPIPCPAVQFDALGGAQTTDVTVAKGTSVEIGVQLYRGAADYVVTLLEIDVLPPGVHANPTTSTGASLESGRLPHVI